MNDRNMNREGILFVISGPSGVGKGTLREKLLATEDNLIYSISATTRKPRPGEVEGRDYHFVEVDRFKSMIEKGELLEWALVYDNYYGTPRQYVVENLKKGRDVLLEIDMQGAMKVKPQFPEGVFIFVMPPSKEELANRLRQRGKDTEEEIARRLGCYYDEIAYVRHYDYMVVNDAVERAVASLRAIIQAERCRVSRLVRGENLWFHRL